jgi:hypothetical protein
MPEYEERMERMTEAEFLMDEADKIMWDKKFKKFMIYIMRYTRFSRKLMMNSGKHSAWRE